MAGIREPPVPGQPREDHGYAATPKEDFLEALRAGAFGVWKERADLGRTDAYVRQMRRGKRVDRLAG